MKKPIVHDWCITCGQCGQWAPQAFESGRVLDTWEEETEENIQKAKNSCPVVAIEIEE